MEGKLRCKMECTVANEASGEVVLQAVVDGSPENEKFFEFTPSGTLSFYSMNQNLEAGKEYYIDISIAD